MDEDDLELLEENTGGTFGRRLTKGRPRDESPPAASSSRHKNVIESSDEDLDEDVQSEMTLVFASLVPILSNVPGAHWDLMFDVVENNLEVCSQLISMIIREIFE